MSFTIQPRFPSSSPTEEPAVPSSSSMFELVSSLGEPDVTMPSTSALEIFQFSTIQSAASMHMTVVETGSLGIHEDLSTTVLTTSQSLTIQGSPTHNSSL